VKIATWNVNGIRSRQAQFLEWIEKEQPDVVCLQELKASLAQVPEQICNLTGYWCYWHGAGAYSGVGLHLRRESFPDEPQFTHPTFDSETRIVEVRAGDTVYASVYVPNGGKDYAAKLKFIVGQRPEERELIESLLAQGLVDVARKLYPTDENYFTWWAPWRNLRQRNIGWRLDYVIASESIAERAIACPSYREVGTSDHAPVVATFDSSP